VSVTSLVGCPVDQLDTPALVLDLDAFEANIAAIKELLGERRVGWRPHAKAHKTPAIAHRLTVAGAHGITCAKLSEAEVYAAAGISDILIANQLAGPIKARRFAQLARAVDVISAVDCLEAARVLDAAAGEAGSRPRVVIEIDCGMHRAGVTPGEPAVALAQAIAALPNLRFAGVMAWEGHVLSITHEDERSAAIAASVAQVTQTADAIRAAGVPVDIVSCGGTGTLATTPGLAGVTEIQAGGGVFGDIFYRKLGIPVQPALSIKVTVSSRPTPTSIIIDAGRKTVDPSNVPPAPVDIPNVASVGFSAEHGNIHLSEASASPKVGESIYLHVGYSDQAVHLHEQFHAVRQGVVTAVWPTLARGCLT